jgi:hypothetical protein
VVLADLQGKGPVQQEAFLLTDFIHRLFVFKGVHELAMLRFWLLLWRQK